MTAVKDAEDIRFQHSPEIFRTHILNGREDANAGVVNENVDAAECLNCVIKERAYVVVVSDVAHRACAARNLVFVEIRDGLVQFLFIAAAYRGVHTGAHKAISNGSTDPFRTAGNDRNFASQLHLELRICFSVLSVSLWLSSLGPLNNHRVTKNTEVAQRDSYP